MLLSLQLRRAVLLVLVLAVTAWTGCQPASIGPPTIDAGHTTCAECGMAVSEVGYAGAVVVEDPSEGSAALAFDDIGCMLSYEQTHLGQKVLARYVMDINSQQWLEVARAWFAQSDAIQSPMASGLAATVSKEAATKLLKDKPGQVLDWRELVSKQEKSRAPAVAVDQPQTAEPIAKPTTTDETN